MSAVATGGKPGHQVAVQLTFPEVFENVYASFRLPRRDLPQAPAYEPVVPMGDDFQARWHNLQREEANRRVMNGVMDTRRAQIRANVSHAGYWKMPKAVLGQRKYANASFGAAGFGGFLYSARDEPEELRGGVLRTAEGQQFGRSRLTDRIAQLNAIEAEKAKMDMMTVAQTSSVPMEVSQGLPDTAGTTAMIEFSTLRQSIMDVLSTGQLERLDVTSVSRFLQLLFRIAPTANREELEDMIAGFDSINELLGGYEEQLNEGYLESIQGMKKDKTSFFYGIKQLLERADSYARTMYARSLLSPSERLALSRNLVKSLGFTSMLTRVKKVSYAPGSSRVGTKGMYIEADKEGVPFIPAVAGPIGFRKDVGATGRFTEETQPWNSVQAYGREARFDPSPRQIWAHRGTAYFGERETADDDSKEDDVPASALRNPAQPSTRTDEDLPEGREQRKARRSPRKQPVRRIALETPPVRDSRFDVRPLEGLGKPKKGRKTNFVL